MRIGLTGPLAIRRIASRAGLASLGLLAVLATSACTTVEGTNAMTDIGTFEREVMNTTARGIGLIPGEPDKEEPTSARAPLVLPKSGQALPAPAAEVAAAQLPANSDTVQIDASNLTEADLQRLRNAKVVDLRSLSGRPLTEEEVRMLTARMQAANMTVSGSAERPLYLPPEEYFTRVGSAELICRTPAGALVSVNDPTCPPQVRAALKAANPGNATSSGMIGSDVNNVLGRNDTGN